MDSAVRLEHAPPNRGYFVLCISGHSMPAMDNLDILPPNWSMGALFDCVIYVYVYVQCHSSWHIHETNSSYNDWETNQ